MGALTISVARSWARPEAIVNRRDGCVQAAALRQNSLHWAISSAVEHLPYKEIVAGSIPASPTLQKPSSLLVSERSQGRFFTVWLQLAAAC